MKKIFLILFLSVSPFIHAQELEEITQIELPIEKIHEVEIFDEKFFSIDFKPLTEYSMENIECEVLPVNIGLRSVMLAASMATSMTAAYGVLKLPGNLDKQKHFLAGYVVGNVTTGGLQLLLPDNLENRKLLAALGGIAASIVVGAGKEMWDATGRGHVDAKDFYATALGGIGGSVVISLTDVKKVIKKRR
jgi:hypothetical protein